VTEAEADDATAAIFADIRATMGVALVNLIWRHLAVSPAALNWSWQSLKPLYAGGAVPRAAWALRQSLALPELSALREQDCLALQSSVSDLALVDAVMRTYERGNAQNLVALCALRSHLRGPVSAAPVNDAQVRPIAAQSADRDAERADRVTEVLPPLPAMADLRAEVRADIESLAQIWVPARLRGMIPSVFRHLAHWPMLLKIYRAKLHELPSAPVSIAQFAARAIDEAGVHTPCLVVQLGAPEPLDAPTRHWLGGALDLFIDAMIGRGVVIVPAMRKVLPQSANKQA
jgi:hypothetical protein